MIYWKALGAAFFLASCTATAAQDSEASLTGTITLSSGPCSGFCPVYRMVLSPDDFYRLDAEDNTMQPGKSRGALPVNSFRRADETLRQYQFDTMAAAYDRSDQANCPDYISDLPVIVISRVQEDQRKRVTFDTGCIGMADRDRLDRLHERLREIFRVRELVAVGEPPKPERKREPIGDITY